MEQFMFVLALLLSLGLAFMARRQRQARRLQPLRLRQDPRLLRRTRR